MINVNMTDKAGVTLATAGKYCDQNVKVTPSADILRKDEQAKTATPTTSVQDITPDAGKALSKVTVNPITAAIVGGLDADSFASAIVAAIEGKGVAVPDGTLLDGMAALIESIEAGGGGADISPFESIRCGTFVGTTDKITIDGVSNCKIFAMRILGDGAYYNRSLEWTISAELVNYKGSRVGCSQTRQAMGNLVGGQKFPTISGDTLTFYKTLDGDYEYIMVS